MVISQGFYGGHLQGRNLSLLGCACAPIDHVVLLLLDSPPARRSARSLCYMRIVLAPVHEILPLQGSIIDLYYLLVS